MQVIHFKRFLSQQKLVRPKEFSLIKCFNQLEVDQFVELTADQNPIHTSAVPLDQRMVPGAYLNAIIAGIMGSKLPGPGCIVIEQKYTFPNACRLNTNVEINLRQMVERKISVVEYECKQEGKLVLQGEAKLLIRSV